MSGEDRRATRRGTPVTAAGLVLVLASMAALFLLPSSYFVAATLVSMSCMVVVTYVLTGYSHLFRPGLATVALGMASAAALYLVFYLGNAGVQAFHPLGMSSSSENSIYSLIVSPSTPVYLQVTVLAFDAAGYESFFRGFLQTRLEPRFGVRSAFLVALLDASVHLLTLNPLWVATTFVADSCWGLTYHYTGDLTSSMLSHFAWDVLIFLVVPIR